MLDWNLLLIELFSYIFGSDSKEIPLLINAFHLLYNSHAIIIYYYWGFGDERK